MSNIATKLDTIAKNQQKVHDAGHAKGHEAGLTEGYGNGYSVGVTSGKKAEREAFWDKFQTLHDGFERTDYTYAFYQWRDENYNPTNPIYIGVLSTNANLNCSTFAYSGIKNTKVPIVITAAASNSARMFEGSLVQTIPDISLLSTSYSSSSKYSGTFAFASYLQEVTFTSPIYVQLNFQWSNDLTPETLRHIIDMLYDYAGNGGTDTYKIIFGSTNLAKLSDDDLSVARNKGWTVN